MIAISKLEEALGDDDWVVVTPEGDTLDLAIPGDIGPATMMVRPVTDALKKRSGERITGAISREEMWLVEAYALNRVVLRSLEGAMTSDELVEAVCRLGYGWQVSQL